MLLSEAARATTAIRLGPTMTNPYLRHPFHTVAALATLQELAGDRIFLGVAAGGASSPWPRASIGPTLPLGQGV
jgi:5,10-methylenetetrahydromethanopterin reductase